MPPGAQLFVVLLVLVLFWFVLMRPARNQQQRVQELQHELEVGDEVVLSAGIFGIIRSLDDGRVKLEVVSRHRDHGGPPGRRTPGRAGARRARPCRTRPSPEAGPTTEGPGDEPQDQERG